MCATKLTPTACSTLSGQPQGFEAHIQTIPSHTDVVAVAGSIRGSLFNAVTDAGESPELAIRLAEIFAWDLDFLHGHACGRHISMFSSRRNCI